MAPQSQNAIKNGSYINSDIYLVSRIDNIQSYECLKFIDNENYLITKLNRLVDKSVDGFSKIYSSLPKSIFRLYKSKPFQLPPPGKRISINRSIIEEITDEYDFEKWERKDRFGSFFVKKVKSATQKIGISRESFGLGNKRDLKSYFINQYNDARHFITEGVIRIFDSSVDEYMIKFTEAKILSEANKFFRRPVKDLETLQAMEYSELILFRRHLSGSMNKLGFEFAQIMRNFFNLTVGIMVWTNIPGTGLAGAGANILKTAFYVMRETILSLAAFGIVPKTKDNLYDFMAEIINNIYLYDKDPETLPLKPEIINRLSRDCTYTPEKFIKYLSLKDLYISIPFVGMISMNKIFTDDARVVYMILGLLKGFHILQGLKSNLRLEEIVCIRDNYGKVFQDLKQKSFISEIRNEISMSKRKIFMKSNEYERKFWKLTRFRFEKQFLQKGNYCK